MKRVAALYDVHANLPALDAVLADVHAAGVEHIVVGGDVVPGPLPREALARLREIDRPISFIQGNGEVAVFAERIGTSHEPLPRAARTIVRWTAQALAPADIATITGWPMLLALDVEGIGRVLFCHGTPRHHNEIVLATTASERLHPLLDPLDVALVVCGHTHMPFDRQIGTTRLVNAGSVGLPFGAPGADWLLLGPDVQLKHTGYDLAAAAKQVRASAYIDADNFAGQILQPPSASAMLDAFSSAELGYGR